MKTLMKVLFAIALCLPLTLSAQYWSGSANTTSTISRGGKVNLQNTTDATHLAGSGVLEIAGALRLDGNEIITNLNTTLYLQHSNNGDLRIDDKTFSVDASQNRVGIGTITPANKLDVNGITRTKGIISSDRVNINNTTDATHLAGSGVLEIAGALRLDGNEIITNSNTTLYLQHSNNGDLRIDDNTFLVDASQNRVGIGTLTPDNELDVNGTIRAKEIIVEEGWSDYVFYDDYQLPTLKEEKTHIKENGHLLGFESEEDMAGEIQLGDVSKRQQAKIEEMMLHLIDLKEEVEQLKEENKQLKKQMAEK